MRAVPHKLYLEGPNTLLVTVKDPLSGEENQVRVNPEDYERWEHGEARIQDAFPYLNADEREILMTGLGPTSWNKVTKAKQGDEK